MEVLLLLILLASCGMSINCQRHTDFFHRQSATVLANTSTVKNILLYITAFSPVH